MCSHQLFAYQDPKALLSRAAFWPIGLECVLLPGDLPPRTRELSFLLAELHKIPLSVILHAVKVRMNDSTTIWCNGCSSHFCIKWEINEGELCPRHQFITADVKLY